MTTNKTHTPKTQIWKGWKVTPVTNPDVLEGMEEYKRILNSK